MVQDALRIQKAYLGKAIRVQAEALDASKVEHRLRASEGIQDRVLGQPSRRTILQGDDDKPLTVIVKRGDSGS